MGEAVTLVPSSSVEMKIGDKLVEGRMFGMSTRDIKGKAVLVEVMLADGRCTLLPWKDVTPTDDVGRYLLGPEVAVEKKKKTEKA
jgi:hypothetical protein